MNDEALNQIDFWKKNNSNNKEEDIVNSAAKELDEKEKNEDNEPKCAICLLQFDDRAVIVACRRKSFRCSIMRHSTCLCLSYMVSCNIKLRCCLSKSLTRTNLLD